MSSAYNRTSHSLIAWGRSFIYKRKSKGPKIEPCGTPHLRSAGSENDD